MWNHVSREAPSSQQKIKNQLYDPLMLCYFLLANRCKINCGDKVTANKKTVIESTCKGLSCKSGQRYNWTLYMLDPMACNETWLPVMDLKEMTLTELDSPNIVIKGGFQVSL